MKTLDRPHGLMQRDGGQQVNTCAAMPAVETPPQTTAPTAGLLFTSAHGHVICCNHNCNQGRACPMQLAFVQIRQPQWPASLRAALEDPVRAAAIHARATQLAQQQRKNAERTAHQRLRASASTATGLPLAQQPLLAHWPFAAALRRRPGTALPAAQDHKRAAAGDRDD